MTDTNFSTGQQQAVHSTDGPVALIAGPGCGKTTTLAGRVAFLINERGFDPSSTLVVSFTTEAARRLRREVARELGDRAGDVAILTLHALGRRVIDTWSIRLGFEDRPSVLHHHEARARCWHRQGSHSDGTWPTCPLVTSSTGWIDAASFRTTSYVKRTR